MEKPGPKIKPKWTCFNNLVLAQSGMKTAIKHKPQIFTRALSNEAVALLRCAERLESDPIIAGEIQAFTWIATHDPPCSNAPVEKAAQNHGVTVGGSGTVALQDGAVIALNV